MFIDFLIFSLIFIGDILWSFWDSGASAATGGGEMKEEGRRKEGGGRKEKQGADH